MRLHNLEYGLRLILAAFVVVLTLGVSTGLIYLGLSSGHTPQSITEHYRGSSVEDPDSVPEIYPISAKHLLMITHAHLIAFAIIYAFSGVLVWHSSLPRKWRLFLALEPLAGSVITFASIWLLRFVHPGFVWFLIPSGSLMYICYFASSAAILRDLLNPASLRRDHTTKFPVT